MNMLKTGLLAGVAMVLAVGVAQASTISGGSFALSQTQTDYSMGLGTYSLFDTTLGTLNSITFTYGYGFNSTITVSAQTASTGTVQTESAAQFTSGNSSIQNVLTNYVDTAGSIIVGSGTLNPAAYDLTGPKKQYNVDANGSKTYTSNIADQSTTNVDSTAADFTPFEAAGGGSFLINVATLTGLNSTATGGNASLSQFTTADQSLSITYNYTTAAPPPTGVPEPASMAVLGAGLLAVGIIRRKKA